METKTQTTNRHGKTKKREIKIDKSYFEARVKNFTSKAITKAIDRIRSLKVVNAIQSSNEFMQQTRRDFKAIAAQA
jgi:hypothetical protein